MNKTKLKGSFHRGVSSKCYSRANVISLNVIWIFVVKNTMIRSGFSYVPFISLFLHNSSSLSALCGRSVHCFSVVSITVPKIININWRPVSNLKHLNGWKGDSLKSHVSTNQMLEIWEWSPSVALLSWALVLGHQSVHLSVERLNKLLYLSSQSCLWMVLTYCINEKKNKLFKPTSPFYYARSWKIREKKTV
jgi:hypothetical protein